MTERGICTVELADLGLDQGGHLLIKRALRTVPVNTPVAVYGDAPELAIHLRSWCRAQGHDIEIIKIAGGPVAVIHRGGAEAGRWRGAESTGDAAIPKEHAHASWGLAGRSATVEAGAPAFDFPLDTRAEVWAKEAARLYAQAAASQWDPATAIPWDEPFVLLDDVEDAVVQVMTYLIENETAALVIPARFASQVHPHFREVMQLLAIQAADEARHIEVFTRRALLRRTKLGLSTVGGQSSLKTLIDEPDFTLSAMLLSVLGEGSFLSLLGFLHQHAPDRVTSEIARLVSQDEARHVAFGIAHLTQHVRENPALLERLAEAIERRHDVLANTAGLNEEVFDALILFAAGSWQREALRAGWEKVQVLIADMDQGRVRRLCRIGFDEHRARSLSALHTRNFM
ncbi:MAG: ferritin-like domain-containing protein [Pseudomonadota bacterium]